MRPRLLAATAIAAGLAVLAMLAIDQPLARWLAARETWPELWNGGIAGLEVAGGIAPWPWLGVCVLVAGVLATALVPRWQRHARAWMFVAASYLLARNLVAWGKFLTGRLRPTEWLAHGGDTTFWRGGFSFPSGHVVLIAGLALPIAIVWPRARPLCAAIAFAMIARVAVGAHFVSDVLGGLALACAVTALCAAAILRSPASPR